jgi:peptide/nickel transport system substrate-binding protein
MLMNLRGDSIFKDKRVRQALSYAVNRDELNEVVYYGKGTVPDSIFPSWHWAHNDFPPFAHDADKAKELLAEAGYDENNPLEFTIYTTAVTQYVDTAVLVQAQLAQIGVIVEIEQVEKSALGQKFTDPEGWIDPPQVLLYRYIQQAPSAYYGWLSYSSLSPYYNDTGYNKEGSFQNPEVEEWINLADSTADRVEAKRLYGLASEGLREDVPDLLLMWLPSVYAFHDYVMELPISPYYQVPMNGVWLDK